MTPKPQTREEILEKWLKADFLKGVPYDHQAIKKAIADWWLDKMFPKVEEKGCCEKCHDVYFEKDYPAHTAYDCCRNENCECHTKEEELPKNKCPYYNEDCPRCHTKRKEECKHDFQEIEDNEQNYWSECIKCGQKEIDLPKL